MLQVWLHSFLKNFAYWSLQKLFLSFRKFSFRLVLNIAQHPALSVRGIHQFSLVVQRTEIYIAVDTVSICSSVFANLFQSVTINTWSLSVQLGEVNDPPVSITFRFNILSISDSVILVGGSNLQQGAAQMFFFYTQFVFIFSWCSFVS